MNLHPNVRLDPPPWRHDAYTLRRMRTAVEKAIGRLSSLGVLCAGESIIVDIGAGDAPYKPLFSAHCKTYITCDIEPGEGVDVVFEEGRAIPLPEASADCVVSFQVLEHVWDLGAYLGECRRLLRPGGRLVLSTHGTWLYHPHPADYRRWTREGLCRELQSYGFEAEYVEAAVGPLAWTTQFRIFAYHHVLSKLGPVGRAIGALFCLVMHARMVVEDAITPASLLETNAAVYCITAHANQRKMR